MNMIASPIASKSELLSSSEQPNLLVQTPADSDGPSLLQEYLRVAWRGRWAIVGSTVTCILLGLIITFLMTPKFTATATIEISRESDQVTNFQGVERDVSVADEEFYQTQYGLLRSRTLAARVATQLGVVDSPDFFEMFGTPTGAAFELVNGRFPASGRGERQRVAGEILLDNLSIDPTRLSRLVDISFSSPEARFSTKVANAWAENFIQTNLERKFQSTSYGREQLQRQLADYKDRLDQSQRQLVTFASQQGIINLPGQSQDAPERSIVVDNLAALNAELASATADRIQAETRYQEAGEAGASTEALTNGAINNMRARRAELAAQYEQLMVQFEPEYPAAQALQSQIDDLDRSINREEERVTRTLRANFRQAQERESGLQAQVENLKQQYLDVRRRSIQYNIFQQEVDTNQTLYDGLLQRFKEIGVAGGVGVNNVSIVDLADVPPEPSSPKLLLNLAASILAGLLLGAALAYALDQLNESITDPSEVKRRLGLPLLGSIPKSRNEEPRDAIADPISDLFDAYLAVNTNLGFTTEHGVPRAFAVTSTRPAEGKSTTALALAAALARTGKKVILVDGDMRSPSVHHLGGVGHDRGLSNFLAGDDKIDDLVFQMNDLGLTAMSAGPIPPNAAQLLTGSRLSALIEKLHETYDHVIIDSPPVMGIADAPLIASKVEGVVYVVEAHGIRTSQVKTALNRLAGANSRILGGVVTKLQPSKSFYDYGYNYGYNYGREDTAAQRS